MGYSVKKSRQTSAKFKAFAVDDNRNFVDTETGSIVSVADIIAKSFGENTPVDLSVTLKDESDITPDE